MLKAYKRARVMVMFDTGTKVHKAEKGKGAYNRAAVKKETRREAKSDV